MENQWFPVPEMIYSHGGFSTILICRRVTQNKKNRTLDLIKNWGLSWKGQGWSYPSHVSWCTFPSFHFCHRPNNDLASKNGIGHWQKQWWQIRQQGCKLSNKWTQNQQWWECHKPKMKGYPIRRPAGVSDWKVLFLFLFLVCTCSFVLLLRVFASSKPKSPPLPSTSITSTSTSTSTTAAAAATTTTTTTAPPPTPPTPPPTPTPNPPTPHTPTPTPLLLYSFLPSSPNTSLVVPVANDIAYSITFVYRYSSQDAHGTDRPVLIWYAFHWLFKHALATQAVSDLRLCLRLFFSQAST